MKLTPEQKKNFGQAKEYFAKYPDAHKWKKMGHTPNTLDYFDSPTFIKVGDRILMTENNADKTIGKGAFAKVLKCCDETGQEYAVRVSGIPIQTELLTKELEKQHEQQNAKMKIIKDKGLTDFSNYMIRESTSQTPTGQNQKYKYTHKIYEPLFRGKSIQSFINESPKLDSNSSEYRKQKLDLAISAFQELEENYIGKNHPHLDIKKDNMVVFTKDNKHIIKFIDVPNYKLEDNPKNESEAKFSQDSEKLAHTPILYEDAFKGLGTNIKKPMLQNIDTFISNAHKKNFQDKKNFFCYDRLTLLSALIKHDKEEFFLSKILKNDAALINDITCGTARNPFNNIFLEKKNVLKVFFIILRADIKIDFDNLLKLAEKDDVIDKISKNPDNPLVIFRTLKKAGIKMQNEYSDELLEINIKSFQRNILSIVTNFIDTKLKSDDKNMINICKKLINLLSTSEKIELKHDEIEILRKNKLGEELRNFAKSKDNDKIWELFGETDKNNPDKTLRGLIALIVKLPEIIIKHNKDSDLTNIDQSPKNN